MQRYYIINSFLQNGRITRNDTCVVFYLSPQTVNPTHIRIVQSIIHARCRGSTYIRHCRYTMYIYGCLDLAHKSHP